MAKINGNFDSIAENYIFSEVAKRIEAMRAAHPENEIINLGIGDITLPLPAPVSRAMAAASLEMCTDAGLHGYPPCEGYGFLRDAIAKYYASRGVSVCADEIFVSEGAKSDIAAMPEIFDSYTAAEISPSYPVFAESAALLGKKILRIRATRENAFLPTPPETEKSGFLIYLCSPANPTGAVFDAKKLAAWVRFALERDSLIIFDAAYEAYIGTNLPRSIFEIPGAAECALEIGSFSKFAGMTGVRVSWCVIPEKLYCGGISVRQVWKRRQSMKFNGVSYINQRGAEAVFSDECAPYLKANIAYYKENARILADVLRAHGIFFTGGENSPYIWLYCGDCRKFFDMLLQAGIAGTPGTGFGEGGAGYFRLSSFAARENIIKAAKILDEFLQSDNNLSAYSS